MEFDHPEGRIVLVAMPEFSAWLAAADGLFAPLVADFPARECRNFFRHAGYVQT
jgi:hypothetical protein